MTRFKHLFFDLDNTILDFSHASHISFHNIMKGFGFQDEHAYEIYNVGNGKVWKEFEEGKISALELRSKRFDIFLEKMGWMGSGIEWNKAYLEHVIEQHKFVEGAEELIPRLSEEFQIHIVTNGLKEVQRPRIHRADLNSYLKSITVSDEIGAAKPQHEFFRIACENGQVSNLDEVLMIGDSYNSDIVGGHLFGIKTCWLNSENKKTDLKIHDFEIRNISEIHQILI